MITCIEIGETPFLPGGLIMLCEDYLNDRAC